MTEIKDILNKYWGYTEFRPLQEEIISAVLDKANVLALLPTGGGKSLCYQLPALAKEGLCLVISPLIALMKDQVEELKSKGIPSGAVYSELRRSEVKKTLENCLQGYYKFLYVSPERLESKAFRDVVKNINISFVAVDEAHCISQWGHDFRPSYLKIYEFLEFLSNPPVIALTATANEYVKEDIIKHLKIKKYKLFQSSFSRPNLSFSCISPQDKEKKILEILQKVSGVAIIYVRNRKKTQEIARFLERNNISSCSYHAGLSLKVRDSVQDSWIRNKSRVMVATNAFGMGINKPDVRVVIHYDLPEDIESYYQEAGRAGRDGKLSYAVLLYYLNDKESLISRIEQKYPSPEHTKKVYQALGNFFNLAIGAGKEEVFQFNFNAFLHAYDLPSKETYFSLKQLEKLGLITYNENFFSPSHLHILLNDLELYKFQVSNPKCDQVIRTILRIYGGEVYSSYVNISEEKIASVAELDKKELRKVLEYLNQNQIVSYYPHSELPSVVFLSPRIDVKNSPFYTKEIDDLKHYELKKAQFMLEYCAGKDVCRQQMIMRYFGEEKPDACGRCDVCLEKRKLVEAPDEGLVKNRIVEVVTVKACTMDHLVSELSMYPPKIIVKVVRELLDSGLLKYKNELIYFAINE
ncbi:MAG: ATP-dependent DNA helicase RecQ [Cytophagaceae bacterium]